MFAGLMLHRNFVYPRQDLVAIISNISFSPDGSQLKTNRGQISMPLSVSSASSYQTEDVCTLFVKDQWVASSEQHLWLPSEYRPRYTAVFRKTICLGHISGHLTILRLSEENMPYMRNRLLHTHASGRSRTVGTRCRKLLRQLQGQLGQGLLRGTEGVGTTVPPRAARNYEKARSVRSFRVGRRSAT